jgi:hypothetical protein
MRTLKNTCPVFCGFAAVLILGSLLLGSCSDLLNEKPSPLSSGGEGGYVLVNIAPVTAARTLLPSAEELFYTLTFTRTSPQATVTAALGGGTTKTVALGDGTWDLVVLGYDTPLDAQGGTPVAEGNVQDIAVDGESAIPVTVELEAAQTGSGTLRYQVSYSSISPVREIRLSLEKRGGGYSRAVNLPHDNISNSTISGKLELPSGYYDLWFYLYNGKIAAAGDLIHIYDALETPAVFNLDDAGFAELPAYLQDLEDAILAARAEKDRTLVGDGAGVDSSWFYIDPKDKAGMAALASLEAAIIGAEALAASCGAGMETDAGEAAALNTALEDFIAARTRGSYDPAGDAALGLFDGSDLRIDAAGTTLASCLEWLLSNNGSIADGASYTIVLGADEESSPWTLGGVFYGKTNIALTLKGKGVPRVISLNANDALFTVDSPITLVLDENITLRGRKDNTNSLVRIDESAALEMKPGSKITGNIYYYGGGGVYVGYNGTFTMNGGEISGNTTSSSGGGVYVGSDGTFTMNGGKISGNTTSLSGGGVYVEQNGTFTMNGGEISGNASSSSYHDGGGGVYVRYNGIFTMNGGEISGNTSFSFSSSYGGGVYVGGIFTMNGGEISGNTSSFSYYSYYSYGGGVYVGYGTFTMSGGEISSNTSSYGGGVYVSDGTFTMSGGEISSNISSYSGGGVYVGSNGTTSMSGGEISGNTASSYGSGVYVEYYNRAVFTVSGGARVNINNPVYLPYSSDTSYASLTIGGAFEPGSGPVVFVEPAATPDFIGKTAVKWAADHSGELPADRIGFSSSGWTVDSNGVLGVKALPLASPGETGSAYLRQGAVHFYRFTPALNNTYTVTLTRDNYSDNYFYIAAVWADGRTLMTTYGRWNFTSSAFIADKNEDIIIMVYNGLGNYTVNYNEQ